MKPFSSLLHLLAKEHTIAGPGFNRWLVPPAALAIHLCIGMAYGFSVFWLPLSKAVGIKSGFLTKFFPPPVTGKFPCLGGCSPYFLSFSAPRLRSGADG